MSTDSVTNTLQLEGELTIYQAVELKKQMLKECDGTTPLEVDLSGITEMDGAGLQLLILLKNEARKRKRTVRFVGHSQAVLEIIDLTNLSGQFGDPLVLAAR